MTEEQKINLLSELTELIKLPESKFLLNDWIESVKNELYFASLGVFITFLEKYLRDILIFREYEINILDKNKEGVFLFDKIEIEIEEWKREYTFNGICNSLEEHKILNKELNDKLQLIYKNIRIPVHHWIYKRLVNYQNNWLKATVQQITINKWKLISKDVEMEQSITFIREMVIKDVFKYFSNELIDIIIEILELENNV